MGCAVMDSCYSQLFLMAFIGVWIYIESTDIITIGGISLKGTAKYLWALDAELFTGLAVIFGTGSLVYLLWLSAVARHAGFTLHPWRPIVISTVLLLICFTLFTLFGYFQTLILDNAQQINEYFKHIANHSDLLHFIGDKLWSYMTGFMAFNFGFILFYMVRAPFNAEEHVELLKECLEKNDDKDRI